MLSKKQSNLEKNYGRKKAELTHCGNTWTRSRYFAFIRSALRRAYNRWPPKYAALKASRSPYVGDNKRAKWQFKCNSCGNQFMQKEVQVHHLIPCGTLKAYNDLPRFVERLLVDQEGLVILCKKCHNLVTQNERQNNKD